MSDHHEGIGFNANEPTDLEARLSKLRLRVAAEGRSRAVREIDLAIEQAKHSKGKKRA